MGVPGGEVIAAGINAAVKASLKLLDQLNDYVYSDDYIFCYWNKPSVRKG